MCSRTFLHVSLGILALAAAYHLGTQNATAQTTGNPVVAVGYDYPVIFAVTANGDTYVSTNGFGWEARPNVFGGGPTPTTSQESFGSVKARYRGAREPQGVKPSNSR